MLITNNKNPNKTYNHVWLVEYQIDQLLMGDYKMNKSIYYKDLKRERPKRD